MHHLRFPRATVFLLALLLPACASSGGAGTADTSDTAPVLTMAEIRAAELPNAYELVSRLRRPWLRRDPRTGGEVRVFLNDREIGGAAALRDIPAVDVAELRYFDGEAAVARWGQAVEASVIEVIRS